MGLADRDYMRERYRQRQGLPAQNVSWNDAKSRCELDGDYFTGSWRTRLRHHKARKKALTQALLYAALSAVIIAGVKYRPETTTLFDTLQRWAGRSRFPETGTVSLSPALEMKRVNSRITLQGADDNAVVQLRDIRSGDHVFSVYVRPGERTTLPAPVGRFKIRFIRGQVWNDSRTFFGKQTTHQEVIDPVVFVYDRGHIFDLRLGTDSNLRVRSVSAKPDRIK